MYQIEFEGSPTEVGLCLKSIGRLKTNSDHWTTLGKSLCKAKHYPLDVRIASTMSIQHEARKLLEPTMLKEVILVTTSDMVIFELPDKQKVVIMPSSLRFSDLRVYARLLPSYLPHMVVSLTTENLKFAASPIEKQKKTPCLIKSWEDILA